MLPIYILFDTFGFRSLMLIKFGDIHYIFPNSGMQKKTYTKRVRDREIERERVHPKRIVREDTSLTPDAIA